MLEPVSFLPATGPLGRRASPTLEPVACPGRTQGGRAVLEPLASRARSPSPRAVPTLAPLAAAVAASRLGATAEPTRLTLPTLRGLLSARGWSTPQPPILAIHDSEQRVLYRATIALPERGDSDEGRAPLISLRTVDSGVDGPLAAVCRIGGEGHGTVYISDPQELLLAALCPSQAERSYVLKSSGNAKAKEEFLLSGSFNDGVQICTRQHARVGGTEPAPGGGAHVLFLNPQAEPLRLLIVASLLAIEVERLRGA